MANKFYGDMRNEMRDQCGDDICAADWGEFYDMIYAIEILARYVAQPDMDENEIDDNVGAIYDVISGSRADLPSVEKYIYAEIERNTK